MKLSTAIKNANIIAERIKRFNGIIETPECNKKFIRIKRAWIFGSTVKGKLNPNDLDVLLDYSEHEIRYCAKNLVPGVRAFKFLRRRGLAKKEYKSYCFMGLDFGRSARRETLKYLKKGMCKISIHDHSIDGNISGVKVMIYPRNDLRI